MGRRVLGEGVGHCRDGRRIAFADEDIEVVDDEEEREAGSDEGIMDGVMEERYSARRNAAIVL